MFTIVDKPTFTHDVPVIVPINGGHRAETIKTTYQVLTADEVDRFDLSVPTGIREFLLAAVIRLDELVDDGKRPVPYSDAVRDQVLALPYARVALVAAYFAAVSKARLGN